MFTRTADGAWESLGGDELGWCSGVSASARDNVWVRCDSGVGRFDGSAWQFAAGAEAVDVCAMSDRSAIVLQRTTTGFAAAHVRMGQPPAQARPATALLGCTHEDVFAIEPSGSLMHRAGGDWAPIADAPTGVMSQYTVGISNLGLTLLRTSPSEALVWDGARWQSRPEAIRSFYGRDRRVRFASREWALRGWPTRALVYRDPPR